MLNIIGAEHRGKQVVREIYGKTAWGNIKSFISYWFFRIMFWGAVSCFVGAGAVSAQALVGFN